ncbi:cytosol aminopeptidase-like [Adelges cooleyi]|uniref:cytosol aminopeptidase-like n=1 Tax=Adelges cooleyi TaxID=133065 RepID=UPI00217F72B3|nr:cytosol aminopeptidase-like [Adelges cooleyi]
MFIRQALRGLGRAGHAIKAAAYSASAGGGECGSKKIGLVLGVYRGCQPGEVRMSKQTQMFDEKIQGKAKDFLLTSNIARQSAVVAHNLPSDYFAVAFADIGPAEAKYNPQENLEECLDWTRIGAGVGARALQQYAVDEIHVESMSNATAAAEGSVLGAWDFEGYKSYSEDKVRPTVVPYNVDETELWRSGTIAGEAQNMARHIAHLPPNVGTPDGIADYTRDMLCKCGVQVSIRNAEWIEEKKMNALLNVGMGSRRTPLLLELAYCGGVSDGKPVVLIGDGCTYDSWGLCLRDNKRLEHGSVFGKIGAASVIGAMQAIARLSLPINVNAMVPLYENKPGGMALKPGSVVKTFHGNLSEVHRTNVSTRLVLSDMIGYSQALAPDMIVNVSTLSVDSQKYLSDGVTYGYTANDGLYRTLESASAVTGDRVIRGPLWKFYEAKTKWPTLADTRVVPHQFSGDSMAAAMFLEDFKPKATSMVTLDVGGSAFVRSPKPEHYLRPERLTGSPVRTIVEFLKQYTCPNDKRLSC